MSISNRLALLAVALLSVVIASQAMARADQLDAGVDQAGQAVAFYGRESVKLQLPSVQLGQLVCPEVPELPPEFWSTEFGRGLSVALTVVGALAGLAASVGPVLQAYLARPRD